MPKRGNPNQKKLVDEIKAMGYEVRVIRNQICVEGEEPMTKTEAAEFIERKKSEME